MISEHDIAGVAALFEESLSVRGANDVIAYRARGKPVTAGEMLSLLRAKDPIALEYVEDFRRAAMDVVGLRARRATGATLETLCADGDCESEFVQASIRWPCPNVECAEYFFHVEAPADTTRATTGRCFRCEREYQFEIVVRVREVKP